MNHTKDRAQYPSATEELDVVHPLNKGLGVVERKVPLGEVHNFRWNLLREDLSLPTAVLYEKNLKHNLQWMKLFVNAYGATVAPHGKTTMAPKLISRRV